MLIFVCLVSGWPQFRSLLVFFNQSKADHSGPLNLGFHVLIFARSTGSGTTGLLLLRDSGWNGTWPLLSIDILFPCVWTEHQLKRNLRLLMRCARDRAFIGRRKRQLSSHVALFRHLRREWQLYDHESKLSRAKYCSDEEDLWTGNWQPLYDTMYYENSKASTIRTEATDFDLEQACQSFK